ncbi:MAG: ABC transporter permease subunit [Armatimonadetes bacterium]|nr:ABC transporter permease subunit [Armatimonadota bacterium]
MRHVVRDLFTENPCLPKSLSSFSRSLRIGTWPASTAIVAVIILLVYACLVALAVQSVTWFEPSIFLYGMLLISILLVAAVLYSGLAGEREKKSLDLLLVAPVTGAQIVAAKLTKAFLPLVASILALMVPAIVIGMMRIVKGQPAFIDNVNFPIALAGALGLTLSANVLVAGVAVYMSALNKTMSSALTATIGCLFALYVVIAVLVSAMAPISKDLVDTLLAYHPFVAMSSLLSQNARFAGLSVGFSSVFHIAVGAGLLWASVRALETERKKGGRASA